MIRAILQHGLPAGLIAFCVVDTHLHALFVGDRGDVGEAMRRIELSCHRRLGLRHRFDGARIRPVRDQRHLRSVIPYILDQVVRHELVTDPLQEGSSLHDLLGLRVPGGKLARGFTAEQPRIVVTEYAEKLGVTPQQWATWGEPLAAEDLKYLLDATCAAFAIRSVRPRLAVHRPVRAAMVQAAGRHSARAIARATGLSHQTVRRLLEVPVPDGWLFAIRGQVWLRRAAAEAAAAATEREWGPRTAEAPAVGSPPWSD